MFLTKFSNFRLTQTSLVHYGASSSASPSDASSTLVNVENWTKWRLYVETDDPGTDSNQVIFGSSARPVFIKNKVRLKKLLALIAIIKK